MSRRNRLSLISGSVVTLISLFGLPVMPALAGSPMIDGDWSRPTLAVSPTKCLGRMMVYDSTRHRAVIFGGFDFNDTWVLDLQNPVTWERLPVKGSLPLPRGECSLVYDPANDRIWTWGGRNSSGASLGDPAYLQFTDAPGESATWVAFNPEGEPGTGNRPGPRFGSGTVYDPVSQAMIFYGGGYGSGYLATTGTWSLSLDALPTWHLLPLSSPYTYGGKYSNVFIDPVRNRFVMQFTLQSQSGPWQDPLALSQATYTAPVGASSGWTAMSTPGGSAMGAFGQESCYHPLQDRIISMTDSAIGLFYGGVQPNSPYSEGVWQLSFQTGSWQQLFPNNTGPLSADDIIYDPDHDRMVVLTGNTSGAFMETWFLTWTGISGVDGAANPSRPSLLVAGAPRPNPFHGGVFVPISLRESAAFRAMVFDAQGRQVRDLGPASRPSGAFELAWDGMNDRGNAVGPGVYFIRVATLDAKGSAVVRVVRTEQ